MCGTVRCETQGLASHSTIKVYASRWQQRGNVSNATCRMCQKIRRLCFAYIRKRYIQIKTCVSGVFEKSGTVFSVDSRAHKHASARHSSTRCGRVVFGKQATYYQGLREERISGPRRNAPRRLLRRYINCLRNMPVRGHLLVRDGIAWLRQVTHEACEHSQTSIMAKSGFTKVWILLKFRFNQMLFHSPTRIHSALWVDNIEATK